MFSCHRCAKLINLASQKNKCRGGSGGWLGCWHAFSILRSPGAINLFVEQIAREMGNRAAAKKKTAIPKDNGNGGWARVDGWMIGIKKFLMISSSEQNVTYYFRLPRRASPFTLSFSSSSAGASV